MLAVVPFVVTVASTMVRFRICYSIPNTLSKLQSEGYSSEHMMVLDHFEVRAANYVNISDRGGGGSLFIDFILSQIFIFIVQHPSKQTWEHNLQPWWAFAKVCEKRECPDTQAHAWQFWRQHCHDQSKRAQYFWGKQSSLNSDYIGDIWLNRGEYNCYIFIQGISSNCNLGCYCSLKK